MVKPATEPSPRLKPASPGWKPGDERPDLPSMLRVDHAGEYGATRIYAGQLAVLGESHPAAKSIARMALQEQEHLKHFDTLLAERGIRPTLMQPVWSVAGHWLGAATALISPEAAMACTEAIEDEIDEHYSAQLRALRDEDPGLSATIGKFQADEREHRDTAIAAGSGKAPGYLFLYSAIRAGCRAAIEISKRI